MKCERCSGYAETAEDVRRCVGCVQDGTAAQIAPAIADNTVLATLCLPDTGLANRFKPGTRPTEDEPTPAPAAPPADEPAPQTRSTRRARGSK